MTAEWLGVIAGFVLSVAVIFGHLIYEAMLDRRVQRMFLIERADEQHRQCLADDPRGVFGAYRPADLDPQPEHARWSDPISYVTIRG